MTKPLVSQDDINRAAWAVCDTYRGTVDASVYKDYVLTMLFLKYISDVWQDHQDGLIKTHGPDKPDLIAALMATEKFKLPDGASFYALHNQRHKASNGERIDKALHAIEEANGDKLTNVFQDISFNANKFGDEEVKNDLLRMLLEDFAKPALDLRPSRVGTLDIIGGAYEYLISKFAAGAGKSAGEFYTPAAVSTLMATLVAPKIGDIICDPICGSGSLLLKCAKAEVKIVDKHVNRAHRIVLDHVIIEQCREQSNLPAIGSCHKANHRIPPRDSRTEGNMSQESSHTAWAPSGSSAFGSLWGSC